MTQKTRTVQDRDIFLLFICVYIAGQFNMYVYLTAFLLCVFYLNI